MSDRIEKTVELKASLARVWRALIDHREFGAWFGVELEGPFVVGETARGRITHPGYEHLRWEAVVREIEPERRFAFAWHPYAVDPKRDYSDEPSTLVEFTLAEIPGGVKLEIVESGFDALSASRRDLAFRMNEGGWSTQIENVKRHVE